MLPRSLPMKNGFESELQMHTQGITEAKLALQAEMDKEDPDQDNLKQLMDAVGEGLNKYAGNAATIKKRVVP